MDWALVNKHELIQGYKVGGKARVLACQAYNSTINSNVCI